LLAQLENYGRRNYEDGLSLMDYTQLNSNGYALHLDHDDTYSGFDANDAGIRFLN